MSEHDRRTSWDALSRELILTCDVSGKVLALDGRAARILRAEVGMNLAALVVPGSETKLQTLLAKGALAPVQHWEVALVAFGKPCTLSFCARPGHAGVVEMYALVMPDDYGATVRNLNDSMNEVLVLHREISRQKKELVSTNAQLTELNKNLDESNKGVMSLHAELSDEFRTPLQTILGLSTLLLEAFDGPLTDEQDKSWRSTAFATRSKKPASETPPLTRERRAMAEPNQQRTVVLNVNDNEDARDMVTLLLQEAGFIVIEASSGYGALEQVERHQPDLVVLDIRLPDIDGMEVCRRLRETGRGKSIKVLHTSATFVTTDTKVQSLDGGADGYLAQPFEPQELLATVRSLLRLTQTEQELRHSAEQLRDADRRKNEFLAMLAHELRNPLAAMSASLPLIEQRAAMDEVERRARDVMRRQILHLGRLVDDLLDVSRVTQGKIELKWEVIDLCALLTRVIGNAEQTKADPRRQQLRLTLPARPVHLRADATRLEQIFINLIDNASKYSDNGSSVQISLHTRQGYNGTAKDSAIISVRDNGIGISPDVLPRLFTLFSQADVPIARSRGGLGIGLTLVRTLVELHGGSVVAKSDGLGRGSEFQVTLPSLPEPDRSSEVNPLAARDKDRVSRKVLVIEDNSDAQQVMKDLLELWGHQVACASDGVSGVNELLAFAPEVALIDIGLPGIDGYEVARQVRAEPAGKNVLLVALTGYGAPEQRTAAIEAGFDLHLVKPVDPERLATLLRQPPPRRAAAAETQPASATVTPAATKP